jgi:archaellum component FlaC
VPISEVDFETLRDGVYELNAALEDVDADVRETGDYKAAFLHLRRAASALGGVEVTVASG